MPTSAQAILNAVTDLLTYSRHARGEPNREKDGSAVFNRRLTVFLLSRHRHFFPCGQVRIPQSCHDRMPDLRKIWINLRVTSAEARAIDDYRSAYKPMLTRSAAALLSAVPLYVFDLFGIEGH